MLGKSFYFGQPFILFVLSQIIVFVISNLSFDGKTVLVIAPVTGHCFFLYFSPVSWVSSMCNISFKQLYFVWQILPDFIIKKAIDSLTN